MTKTGRIVIVWLLLLTGCWLESGKQADAQNGNWSVLAPSGSNPGQVNTPLGVGVDGSGNLYVTDGAYGVRLQERDAKGNWTVLSIPEQFSYLDGVAVDGAGNLFVSDFDFIQKRDSQGNWTVLAPLSSDPFPVGVDGGLAVDGSGNLFVADYSGQRIEKRDAQGNWTVLATNGSNTGQVSQPEGVAVDSSGNLYVADYGTTDNNSYGRIQKRDSQGNWTVLATPGRGPGQVGNPNGVAVDGSGNLFVTDLVNGIQERNAKGKWTILASTGSNTGQVSGAYGVAVDELGNLFVADTSNNRIQELTPGAPSITSGNSATFTVGMAGSFTVTTNSYPLPNLSETGSLPSGVTFTANGDGTATLSGTPAAGTGRAYPLTNTANNGFNSNATQLFTLTVNEAPSITSGSSVTFAIGTSGSFKVTSTGYPKPTLSETGPLPSNVSFKDNGDGTGTLSGTPVAGTEGTYPLTFMADNTINPIFSQPFTLTVIQPPIANPQSVSLLHDRSKALTLVATISNGDPLTYSVVILPANTTVADKRVNSS